MWHPGVQFWSRFLGSIRYLRQGILRFVKNTCHSHERRLQIDRRGVAWKTNISLKLTQLHGLDVELKERLGMKTTFWNLVRSDNILFKYFSAFPCLFAQSACKYWRHSFVCWSRQLNNLFVFVVFLIQLTLNSCWHKIHINLEWFFSPPCRKHI